MKAVDDDIAAAIKRYEAMAGWLSGVLDAVEQQGRADRERFGAVYLVCKDGEALWHPPKIVRFMVEVCGLPLGRSYDGLAAYCASIGMGEPLLTDPEEAARLMVRDLGDVLETLWIARFTARVCEGSQHEQFWNEVVGELETKSFVEEDTGIANWNDYN